MAQHHPRHARTTSRRTRVTGGIAALVLTGSAGLAVAAAGDAAAAATAVPLGTAGQFAVLAGSGITNTGATTIGGDTGSSPTATETGFASCPGAASCVSQTGTNHTGPNPNDGVTQQAKTALRTAYTNAAGQGPTTEVATELGGQKLVAGVYGSASGTFGMTGTLVLDGANNPGSVFVFQTSSTLITAAASTVSLINGASPCNIFWQVGSAATLGTGSGFVGTVLAHDDISLAKSVTVDGRLLAGGQANGAGAVTLINDTITAPSCATPTTTTTATTTATTTTSGATPTTVAGVTTTTAGATTTTPGSAPTTTTGAPAAGGAGRPGGTNSGAGGTNGGTGGTDGASGTGGSSGGAGGANGGGANGGGAGSGGADGGGGGGASGGGDSTGNGSGSGSSYGTQVRQVPVGGVDTGDGSVS